jgi:hypothetical protein
VHEIKQSVQVKAEEAIQQALEGTQAPQAKAGEVLTASRALGSAGTGETPGASGGAHRTADSQGQATAAARCGGRGGGRKPSALCTSSDRKRRMYNSAFNQCVSGSGIRPLIMG